ncbi:MAG: tRNA pseudouridine(55) synthase TruB [Gammaproteobacteria bacterium]|nr:tRNA pseudouridine(55) synthase TruB [Gammaproteobacteria bacterium]
MARRHKARGRKVNGILLLDKPVGITSNAALQEVKRLLYAAKAGHTGNLDPLASGMLPICLGEATKLSAYLLDADKVYLGTCKLGVRTTTADAEGEIVEERPVPALSESQVDALLEQFRGDIEQIPPMHSAIKQNGQPLYKLARQGIEVERKPRQVTIHELRIVRLEGDEIELYIHCSKGTYIRTLVEDLGEALGCGAHLSQLRRTRVGPFQEEGMVTLDTLREAAQEGAENLDCYLLPMDHALGDYPEVKLSESSLFYVQQGQAVQVAQAPTEGWVRLFDSAGGFVGVGAVLDDGRIAPKRLISQNG